MSWGNWAKKFYPTTEKVTPTPKPVITSAAPTAPVTTSPEHEEIKGQLQKLSNKVNAMNKKINVLTSPAIPVTQSVPVIQSEPAMPSTEVSVTPPTSLLTSGGKRRKGRKGGYRVTKKDKAALKKLRQGKSIGFTMRSSLKAKGLLRRANGTYRVSKKYQ